MAVWNLRAEWDKRASTTAKLERVGQKMASLKNLDTLIEEILERPEAEFPRGTLFAPREADSCPRGHSP
jgi:hypothetical protein